MDTEVHQKSRTCRCRQQQHLRPPGCRGTEALLDAIKLMCALRSRTLSAAAAAARAAAALALCASRSHTCHPTHLPTLQGKEMKKVSLRCLLACPC